MLVSSRYAGIEIPVFSPETEVICNMKRAKIDPNRNTIIRACRVTGCMSRVFKSLTDYLEAADKELTEAATWCGAKVVPHLWGLYRIDPGNPNPKFNRFTDKTAETSGSISPILPEDHILVSEVDVVKDINLLNAFQRAGVQMGIRNYRDSKNPGGFVFADNNPLQYASGIVTTVNSGKRDLRLIDVEPLIIER